MRHRGHHEGTLYFDSGRDRWVAGYSFVDDAGRRRQRRQFFAKKRDAQVWLNVTIANLEKGQEPVKDPRLLLARYLDVWLDWKRPEIRASSYRQYEHIVRVHLVPGLGNRPLGKLSAADVQHFLADRASQPGLAPNTVRLIARVLRMSLKRAHELGLVASNVALLAAPTRDKRQVRNTAPLSTGQLERLLDASQGRSMEHLFALAAATGLRKSELLGLRWSDVDFEVGRLFVRQALVWLPGQPWSFDAPKTDQGTRQFPLIPPARAALKAQRARVAALQLQAPAGAWQDLDLVFPSELGTPLHPSNVNRELKKVLRLADLDPTQTFHNLRHGAATYLLEGGVDPRVVMDLMGWSQMSMLQRYQAVRSGMIDDAARKLAAVFPARASLAQ
jgi:integrase